MWVLDLEAAPPRLRGLVSRWSIEVRAGLYVGSTSGRVRDDIWGVVLSGIGTGNAVLVYDAQNDQGFEVRTAGPNRRDVVDVDGAWLARFRPPASVVRVPWDDEDLRFDAEPSGSEQ